eukprot:Pgem_evm1s3706
MKPKKQSSKPLPNKDAYFEKVEKAKAECKATTFYMVKGVDDDEDESEDDLDEEERDHPMEKWESLRLIMINEDTIKQCDAIFKQLTSDGDDSDDSDGGGFFMSNTNSSYQAYEIISRELNRVQNVRGNPPSKYKKLLALTIAATCRADFWIFDNEMPEAFLKLIKKFGSYWKNMLQKHTDAQLEIDTEYSREGIKQMMNDLQKRINSLGYYGK